MEFVQYAAILLAPESSLSSGSADNLVIAEEGFKSP